MVVARALIDAATAAGDSEAELEGRRTWAQLRPGPASATNLAAALARTGRFREAATTLAKVVHGRGIDHAAADRALDEGRYWAAAGELQPARAALARARDAAPASATQLRRDVFTALVDVARRQGDLESMARSLARPRDVVEWEAKAAVVAEQGDSRSAWNLLDEAIRRRPNDIELHRRRIAAASRVATAAETAHLLEVLAAVGQRNFDAAAVGEALDGLWRLGQSDLASVAFDRLLARADTSSDLIRTAAELAARWDDDRRAERGWQALVRRDPRDESAIVALGEVRLQRGDRKGAVETWRSLLRASSSGAEAHARLAETLADHELTELAVAEAHAAISLAPRQTRYWRVLAGILERQSKRPDAEEAWENVLRLGRVAGGVGERREARTHLVTLWIRDGSGRVGSKLAELEEYLREQPGDEDVRLCLVEAYLRTERPDAAVRLLKQTWDRASSTDGDGPVDLVFALVKVLRQRQRTADAMTWLETIVARFPARAREARLQLAEMALAEREDDRALSLTSAAVEAAGNDVVVAMRAGAIEERTGDLEAAMKTYRRATGEGDAAGALALASLMARRGVDADEQRTLLRGALLRGTDEELLIDAGRRAIVLEEGLGSLEELATRLADGADLNVAHPGGAARRRILASILTLLVPAAYRLRDDDLAAATRLRRYGRDGVRPLLELAAAAETEVDVSAINALGMLGHAETAAELSRLLIGDEPAGATRPRATRTPGLVAPSFELKPANSDVMRAIVVALGRLGGDVARATLESVARLQHPALAVPLLWSLGRVGSPLGAELASREISRASTDTAVIACLTLGRVGGPDAATILTDVATDRGRAPALRAAAVIGLTERGALGVTPGGSAVRRLAQSDDDGLVAQAARMGLTMRSRGETQFPDDAILISGSSIEPEALVRDLVGAMARRYAPSSRSAP